MTAEETEQRCFPQASILYGCATSRIALPAAFLRFSPCRLFHWQPPPLPQQEVAFWLPGTAWQ
ncbi:hypothetical protein [Candidatus Pantoea persica]|uniref:hypothetical protein n=1 Tax=Candidatus Pantoea persica TaxID=2518128 RepID=UPI00215DBDA4|nr:hypothetical protein [Candidatus Pantoea persica]MBA2817514.1 pilus assembly protein HofM [Candidatus Pantoea persica]